MQGASECMFENFKIFKNHEGDLSPETAQTKHVITS